MQKRAWNGCAHTHTQKYTHTHTQRWLIILIIRDLPVKSMKYYISIYFGLLDLIFIIEEAPNIWSL